MLVAASCNQFLDRQVETVQSLRKRFQQNTDDIEWLSTLGQEKNWAILSQDSFRKRDGAERQVIRRYGLSIFVLKPAWSSQPYWARTAQIVHWWPRIVAQANSVTASTVWVPWKSTTKFEQM